MTSSWIHFSLVYQEDAGNLVYLRELASPLFYCAGLDVFVFGGEAGGNAEMGLGAAGFQDVGHHLRVTVGRFYEELGLILGVGSLFQFL